MAAPYKLFELWCANESAFGEFGETPGSATWSKRISPISYSLNLQQERIVNGELLARSSDQNLSHIGPRACSLEFTMYLGGHNTTTAGALTATALEDLLSRGLGGGNTAATGTTVSAASSGSSVTFTATTGWAAGQIGRIGNKQDARANGQAFVMGTVGAPCTFLTAVPATPANPDVIYATQQVYHDESLLTSLSTLRFMCGYSSSPTTGAQYMIFGCQLASLTLNFPLGGLPTVTFRYTGAYWQRSANTIPSVSLTLENNFVAPSTGGSMFIQDVGTATNATITPANLTLNVDLGLEPVVGPGGVGTYQSIVGWARTMCTPTLTVQIPWSTTYETWFDVANQSFIYKHILFTANAVDGRSVGFYLPRVSPVGNRPSQVVEVSGQLYVPVVFRGREGTVTTNELTRSAVRIFMG